MAVNPSLQQVLDYCQNDSLKYEAAKFLIENLPFYHSYSEKDMEAYLKVHEYYGVGTWYSVEQAMDSAVKQSIAEKAKDFSALCAKLDAMSPLRILARGYGIASKDGAILTDSACVDTGDKINVTLSRGSLECEVVSVSKDG